MRRAQGAFAAARWIPACITALISLTSPGCLERIAYEGPGAFELSIEPKVRDLRIGASIEINVTALRGPGSDGTIALTADDLPRGFSFERGAIAAGVDKGVLTIHADAALPGVAYRLLIVGRGDGALAEREIEVFVTGASGTVDAYLPRIGESPMIDVPPPHDLLPISPGGGLLLSANGGFYRYDANGRPDLSFGAGGFASYDEEPYGPGRLPLGPPQVVGELADGKLVVAVGYGVAELEGSQGFLLFRLTADGALDRSYGPSGDAVSVVFPYRGYQPISVKVLDGDDLLLYLVDAAGTTNMVKISRRGELLIAPSSAPLTGPLDAERRAMALQPDGKLVAAGGTQLVRFTPALQVDASFGQGGVMAMGTVPPFVTAFAGGYLAAGATAAGPTIWSFDEAWRPRPGFAGGRVIPGASGRAVSVHAVPGGYNVAIAAARAQVVRLRPDGAIDPTFGEHGVLDLGPLPEGHPGLPHFETSHGRFYSATVNGPLYEVTRYWGE